MSLRPRSARWFEILAPKNACSRTLGVLARSGAVEVEVHPARTATLDVRGLATGLAGYRQLADRYRPYWRGRLRHEPVSQPPGAILQHAMVQIGFWREEADPLIRRIETLQTEQARLRRCRRILEGLSGSQLDFDAFLQAGPWLTPVTAIMPLESPFAPLDEGLSLLFEGERERYLLALIPTTMLPALDLRLKAAEGYRVLRPEWLRGTPADSAELVRARLSRINQELLTLYAQLDDWFDHFDLPSALGDTACLEWFVDQVGALPQVGETFVWITGWTSEAEDRPLQEALASETIPALYHPPPTPPGAVPPQLLDNPPWVRPFEFFARSFGLPGRNEADPSAALSLIVPLLFGYMFGDLGQGLVLAAIGWWLRPIWSGGGMLMLGGISAAIFGLLFGSVFSREDWIPALAFHPLHDPFLTLVIPILLGILILLFGQLLNGLEAWWRGEGSVWLRHEAALLLIYLSGAGLALDPDFLYPLLIGVAWFLLGRGWRHILSGIANLLEDGMRLLVNTVSFARVGAFALAHAGLSSALMTLADGTGSLFWAFLIMLLGNALVILLEGLAVSVQTTRLVLFEFFMRFLKGEGRAFRPIAPPPDLLRGRFS